MILSRAHCLNRARCGSNGEEAGQPVSLPNILKELRLKISPHKTRMGILSKGFHFLGVNFEVTRILQSKIQIKIGVHKRTPRRAFMRIQALRTDAVNSANIQRYLMRWAIWWHHAVGFVNA